MYNESGIAAAYSELLKHMEDFALNNPMEFFGNVLQIHYCQSTRKGHGMD
jgi:hypothetical protein